MIKKLAWETFKNTGNINTFLELVEFENAEKNLLVNSNRNMTQNIPNATYDFIEQPNVISTPNSINDMSQINSIGNNEIEKRTN